MFGINLYGFLEAPSGRRRFVQKRWREKKDDSPRVLVVRSDSLTQVLTASLFKSPVHVVVFGFGSR